MQVYELESKFKLINYFLVITLFSPPGAENDPGISTSVEARNMKG